MLPLRVAILWHQHQPYYKKEKEFLLPWVRLHGVKDYYDLPALLTEFPAIRQTFNLAPSLLLQIRDYVSNGTEDKVQRLTKIPAAMLSEGEKDQILRAFFLCNYDRMIKPYPRFLELYERAKNHEGALRDFTPDDWRDLQTWYNLTWIGQISRQDREVQYLFRKGRDYSEQEKNFVLEYHKTVLHHVIPEMQKMLHAGNIELSVSPMYHPILPLLCDSRSALEAMPDCPMPDPLYRHPEDAEAQIGRAVELYEELFHTKPAGCWPSEGSISDEALALLKKGGFRWAASDEDILKASFGDRYVDTEIYFPRVFASEEGDIAMIFRDHALSDAIGFIYANWDAEHAAEDFCMRLRNIRERIVRNHGEKALESAVVPVILDGENCWEYYEDNGVPFLTALYERLSKEEFRTVTVSEAVQPEFRKALPSIGHIRAGSWINANFRIWIGHDEDREAWSMLARARDFVRKQESRISPQKYAEAMEAVYIAEGSDWYWWYGDDHMSENSDDFDQLFRYYIGEAYRAAGAHPPEEVYRPIKKGKAFSGMIPQHGKVSPKLRGKNATAGEWKNAGYYHATQANTAMHRADELLNIFRFAGEKNFLYFRFEFTRPLAAEDNITIDFFAPEKISITVGLHDLAVHSREKKIHAHNCSFVADETLELKLPRKVFFDDDEANILHVKIFVRSNGSEQVYPQQERLQLSF